ncbi:hypothetical protein TWF481_008382 [Arthrobotrys musiformis]|uniref:Terpene synthase n=1 Tax=Arthrobotrys musiformis TaxID=47236 RepID=A0AAV9W8Z2_9PEZI
MTGLLHQENFFRDKAKTITPEEYLSFRRTASGGRTMSLFVEWAVNMDAEIPACVIEHPSVLVFRELAVEIVALCNDLFSSIKDIPFGEGSNLVVILLRQGFTLQEAVDKIGDMVCDRYEKWEEALRCLPKWGKGMDVRVRKLIQGYADMVWGNLYWRYVPKILYPLIR